METLKLIISAGTNFFEAIQLSNDLSNLRASLLSCLPKARLLIDRAEWGRFKNKDLAVLLSQLKDATYDAEDLLRQFNDQVERHRIEDADRSRAGQIISSSVRVAKDFILGSKAMIKETQGRLERAVADIEGLLGPLDLSVEPVQLMPETTSVLGAPEVFGRDQERDELIDMLGVTIGRENEQDEVIRLLGVPPTRDGRSSTGTSGKRLGASVTSTSRGKRLKGKGNSAEPAAETNHSAGHISVLVIVGIGGVGKTTLAQFIYNDARVKTHFDMRIWVCVSDLFDKRRITREILESISGEEYSSSTSLNVLQEKLDELIGHKKLLLVLDDVWPNAIDDWEAFSAPLRHGLDGSMILVTTRSLEVANSVANIKPLQLEGLPTDIFWEFFKKCAFGKENPESYPRLQGIGQSIADRLCGSPLAAKTLGRLLNMDLTEQHWSTIQNNELWELPHRENEILPALQLSYMYLPQELKRCFAFCSMFPKDYSFERDEIVDIWVAQGFVAPIGSVRLEDAGCRYLDDLRSRFLFQTDPKFPRQRRYVMHDLIHDMAQYVSVDECILMQDIRNQNHRQIPPTIRHMSIEVNNEYLRRPTVNDHLNKLRSLRFGIRIEYEIPWFGQLSNILFLSLKGCQLEKIPDIICGLNSVRYLDISHSRVQELPESFWGLCSLQFFYANRSSLQKIHRDVVKLTNLRSLALPAKAYEGLSKLSGLGKLSSLRNLRCFVVGKEDGRRISELKCMNQLSGKLSIKSIHNVESHEAAAEARLVDKQYLKELVLSWEWVGLSTGKRRRSSTGARSKENGVLEALQPPLRIERLKIQGFRGDISPSWLQSEYLQTLRTLELIRCYNLLTVPIQFPSLEQLVLDDVGVDALTACADGTPTGSIGDHSSSSSRVACLPLTRLTNLRLRFCSKLKNVEQFLCPEYLPSIKSIELMYCTSLVLLPVHRFVGFVHLQDLKMWSLSSLICPREMVLPPSLLRLSICYCPMLEASLPSCLENLTTLSMLHLTFCNNLKSVPLSMMDTQKLQCLVLADCKKLSSIGGASDALSRIRYVDICDCPKLSEVQQPFLKNELRTKEVDELAKFIGRDNVRSRSARSLTT